MGSVANATEARLAAIANQKIGDLYKAIEAAVKACDAAGEYALIDRPMLRAMVKAGEFANFDDLPEWAGGAGQRAPRSPIADRTEWVEDAELGVAVREVGANLHIRPLTAAGWDRIDAGFAALHEFGRWEYRQVTEPMQESGHYTNCFWIIPPAHRLAFARALSPIKGQGKTDSPVSWTMHMGTGVLFPESTVAQ